MSQSEWYCQIDGEVIGPVSDRGLRTMAAVGELMPSDEVRNGAEGRWQLARTIQGLQFTSSVRKPKIFPQGAVMTGAKSFVYKMVQVPPNIVVQEKEHKGDEAAVYLENLVNQYAQEGWEFYRVDTIGVKVMPGCLWAMFMALSQQPSQFDLYYVVTFRRVVE